MQALASGAFRDRLAREGVVGVIGSPQDLRAVAEQEAGRWKQVVKDKEIRIE
ncbi:hypothetical protein D8I24_2694 (plasmid) [Cupriavidus necator H850]|nr:hypothetical protein D8I24_2694 [Cupriavidus necator H850]